MQAGEGHRESGPIPVETSPRAGTVIGGVYGEQGEEEAGGAAPPPRSLQPQHSADI